MFSNHAYNKNLSRGKQYTIFTSVTKQTRNQILEAYYWSEGKKYIFELLMNISLSSFADCRRSLTFHRHSQVACLFHMNCKTLFGLRSNSVTGRATKLLKQTLGRPFDSYLKFSSVKTNRWRVQINALKSVSAS